MLFQNTDALAQNVIDPLAPGCAGVAPVYYHGTLKRHLDSILENGLSHKATLGFNHVCLATRAHVSHFFGNINAAFSNHDEKVVIITIPAAHLDPQHFCIEGGTINSGAYGREQKRRTDSALKNVTGWEDFQFRTDTVGYGRDIPVTEDMIDWRPAALEVPTVPKLLKEIASGDPSHSYPEYLRMAA